MKIYILADMEGASGIGTSEQIKGVSPHYEEARRLFMDDVNTAIDAAFTGGATEVVACDTHAGGGQIRIGDMDPRAVYETPACGRLMPSLDESFQGLILVGQHAAAGTMNGFLDHTISSGSWFEYRINGQVLGEIGIEAAYAGHYHVPVIAVSGDETAAREAIDLLGHVECAVVKWGMGRNRARCLSVAKAREAIRQAVHKALGSIHTFRPYRPALPATVQLTLCRSDMADELGSRPGIRRVDARTVSKEVTSLLDICLW